MKQISVLIIEDSVYSADLNIREIRKAGFIVEHRRVASEKAMLQALHESPWDIIVSDNSMPNFSALQALDIRNSMNGSIPFIIVSEDIAEEDVNRAFKNGCCAYIAKENLPELRKLVKNML